MWGGVGVGWWGTKRDKMGDICNTDNDKKSIFKEVSGVVCYVGDLSKIQMCSYILLLKVQRFFYCISVKIYST